MKKFLRGFITILFVYLAGIIVLAIYFVLRLAGMIKIVKSGKFPKLQPGMFVVSNHPDLFDCMYEIFLLPTIFARQIFCHPIKLAPWFTPDRRNFTDKWYFSWLRARSISIQRGASTQTSATEARMMLTALKKQDGLIMFFPEGGRTCTGKKFLHGNNGNMIRELASSTGWLISKTQSPILPIWFENGPIEVIPGKRLFSWPNFSKGPITIKVGQMIVPSQELLVKEPSEITSFVAQKMLELADRE